MGASKIFKETYSFILNHVGDFFILTLKFLPLVIILTGIEKYLLSDDSLLVSMLNLAVDGWFAFLWHRLFLLNPGGQTLLGVVDGASEDEKNSAKRSLSKFILYSIGLGLIIFAAFLSISLGITLIGYFDFSFSTDTSILLGLLLLIPVAPLFFRIAPLFPAIARGDKNVTIKKMWLKTSGKTISITLSFLFTFIPILVLLAIYIGILFLGTGGNLTSSPIFLFIFGWVLVFLQFFALAVAVTTNSEIYRQLTGFEMPNQSPSS